MTKQFHIQNYKRTKDAEVIIANDHMNFKLYMTNTDQLVSMGY